MTMLVKDHNLLQVQFYQKIKIRTTQTITILLKDDNILQVQLHQKIKISRSVMKAQMMAARKFFKYVHYKLCIFRWFNDVFLFNLLFLKDHSIFENSNLGDIPDIVGGADKQVDCDNSPVRNLNNVDAGFSSSKSIIPSPSFVFDKPKKIRPLVFESQHDFTDQDDNDEEDQFIFPTPIQSIVPLEGSPQSQFELDDSLMPSLSDIKSICATDNTINAEQSITMHIQTTSNDNSNIQKQASKDSQNKKSPVHTPLPAHRIRRLGPFNTSPYMTSFGSSAAIKT
ncbi:uncharacterized protein LOC107019713 [Solanum pennellii]|uniref:Uncharacterized protein LOC107019713 n=1 Tax=Solanum pennellii TaxID=28526 RepID=A0ABM1VAR8_SOLPN|nr:uncharacterized protein LOC107019713 [Solanum pennellii]